MALQFVSSSDCKKYLTSNSSARVATTRSYIEAAVLGPREAMYTPAQAAKKHPTSGEVMVSGQMGNGSSMTMGMNESMAHLEIHICSKKSGVDQRDADDDSKEFTNDRRGICNSRGGDEGSEWSYCGHALRQQRGCSARSALKLTRHYHGRNRTIHASFAENVWIGFEISCRFNRQLRPMPSNVPPPNCALELEARYLGSLRRRVYILGEMNRTIERREKSDPKLSARPKKIIDDNLVISSSARSVRGRCRGGYQRAKRWLGVAEVA